MAILFRDFAAHCQGLISTTSHLILEEFSRDYVEGRFRLIHPDLSVLLNERGGDWEAVFLYVFASDRGDDCQAFPYAFGYDSRKVMVDIDIRARLDAFHAANVTGSGDASSEEESGTSSARTLGGMLICRAGERFETIAFIPVELSVVDAMTYQGVCLTRAIPGYGNTSPSPPDEDDLTEFRDPNTVRQVEALLASTPTLTTERTAQNGSPFLVLRERLARLRLPMSAETLLARGLDDLAANDLRLWPESDYETRVMLDGQTGWEIVYLYVVIAYPCEGDSFHTESMYFMDPSLRGFAGWALILASFSLCLDQARKAVPEPNDDKEEFVHKRTAAAWVVVRDRSEPTGQLRSLVYLHHKLQPSTALDLIEEDVQDSYLP